MVKNIAIGITETEILKSSADETNALLVIIFCNTTGSSKTISIFSYPDGSSGDDTTVIVKNYDIAPYDSFIWDANSKLVLAPNETISAIANEIGIIATPSYYQL